MSFDKEFKIFYENISLTDAKKDNLLSSKEALRNKIRTSFDDNERKKTQVLFTRLFFNEDHCFSPNT